MWCRVFPGLVLLAVAIATVAVHGLEGPPELRLVAAGISIVLLIAAVAVLRRREPAATTAPAPAPGPSAPTPWPPVQALPRELTPPIEASAPAPVFRPDGPTPLPSGTRLVGRQVSYEIINKLAAGGMGEVFLAWQNGPRRFRRHVVLKRLHARLSNEPTVVDMFLNEAQLVAGLSHPNIVPIHELFQDGDGSYVLVMEYIFGPTLLAVLREHNRLGMSIPYGPLVRIGGAISDALHHAYASAAPDGEPRRIIHRDVSPSNIMIRYDGEVKLLDFGLAKVSGVEAMDDAMVTGKLGYMSPEQLCGEALDHQTDVFSLGIVLWEMATGRRLFRRQTENQMIHAILRAPIPPARTYRPDMNPQLDAIIARALIRDRRRRYDDAGELAGDLRELADLHHWPRRQHDLIGLARSAFVMDARHGTLDDIPTAIDQRSDADIRAQDGDFLAEPSPHTAIQPLPVPERYEWLTPT